MDLLKKTEKAWSSKTKRIIKDVGKQIISPLVIYDLFNLFTSIYFK
jgi:hypothetical protein